ncbi:MAG: hypothetical protein QXH55_00920 [Candidatus Korarchaeota archaeon]|nr:hypothetical protein [Thermoproteota archaeon]MCR8462699.1 hypothetical protein [Thermoproteota archaeon]MCR8470318.1 hypothetical protein [Thermoproteota archaeon]MCR8471664.1 hypothetical protein [Thermoproteota archaeon]MCR8472656.1 hypothetical protein [Thermoproteota archaeon]
MHIVILESPCIEGIKGKISVWDIDEVDIYSFLARLRDEGRYIPSVASALYNSVFTRLQRAVMRLESTGEKVLLYLVTPYGVISEEDYVISIKECFDNLSVPELEILFERFQVKNKIYDMIEQDFDTAIICLNHKILKVLDLEYHLPATKPVIIISDAYMTSKSNILVIPPTHHMVRKAFKLTDYGLELCISVVNYVLRAMSFLAKQIGTKNFRELLRDSRAFLQVLLSQETIDRVLGKKGQKLDLFIED